MSAFPDCEIRVLIPRSKINLAIALHPESVGSILPADLDGDLRLSPASVRLGGLTRLYLRHSSDSSIMHLRFSMLLAQVAASIFTAGVLCGITGCGGSGSVVQVIQPPGNSYTGVTFGGKAMAGTQPLIGAAVQLYTAGTSGNGSSGSALLTSALTTDGNGAFTVPGGYVCPLGTSQVYVVAQVAACIHGDGIRLKQGCVSPQSASRRQRRARSSRACTRQLRDRNTPEVRNPHVTSAINCHTLRMVQPPHRYSHSKPPCPHSRSR